MFLKLFCKVSVHHIILTDQKSPRSVFILSLIHISLEELIVTSYPYVYGTDLIDECIEDLKDYSEDSIPVLDNDNRLLGVITVSYTHLALELSGDDCKSWIQL